MGGCLGVQGIVIVFTWIFLLFFSSGGLAWAGVYYDYDDGIPHEENNDQNDMKQGRKAVMGYDDDLTS